MVSCLFKKSVEYFEGFHPACMHDGTNSETSFTNSDNITLEVEGSEVLRLQRHCYLWPEVDYKSFAN